MKRRNLFGWLTEKKTVYHRSVTKERAARRKQEQAERTARLREEREQRAADLRELQERRKLAQQEKRLEQEKKREAVATRKKEVAERRRRLAQTTRYRGETIYPADGGYASSVDAGSIFDTRAHAKRFIDQAKRNPATRHARVIGGKVVGIIKRGQKIVAVKVRV